MVNKTLVLYVFHIFNEYVEYFIDNCIFEDENVDFIIISNNLEKIENYSNIKIPNYVKVLYRDNIGYDFGGWSEALLTNNLYKNYDYFIFANSSIIGPFIHDYFTGKWTDIYINGLTDNIKLFGSTINFNSNPNNDIHIQSYIFSTDKEGLEYLIENLIFSVTNIVITFNDAIQNKEIEMSRLIHKKGWRINSLSSYYNFLYNNFVNNNDYNIIADKYNNDIMYEQYRNILWNEYELVFIKGNRIPIFPPNYKNKNK